MYKRTNNNNRNNYSKYIEVYKKDICMLYKENKIDETCNFRNEKYKNMIKNRSGRDRAVIWFEEKVNNKEELSRNEIKINRYLRDYGKRFFILKGIKEYLKEISFKKDWKVRNEIIIKYIRERMSIYQERCKEYSKKVKVK